MDHFPEGFTLFNYDYGRIPGIMEERALAYRILYMRTMVEQGVLPDETRLKFLQLRHIDAVWKDDLSDLPESCKNEKVKLANPVMVTKRLASVVTRLAAEPPRPRRKRTEKPKHVAPERRLLLKLASWGGATRSRIRPAAI